MKRFIAISLGSVVLASCGGAGGDPGCGGASTGLFGSSAGGGCSGSNSDNLSAQQRSFLKLAKDYCGARDDQNARLTLSTTDTLVQTEVSCSGIE